MFDFEKAKSVLENHKIAEEMANDRIFQFDTYKEEIWIQEACDGWYGVKLTAETCQKIASLFSDLEKCF